MIKRFIAFYGPHKPLFALDLSMAFVRALCAILIPLVTKHLFEMQKASGAEIAGIVALLMALVAVLAFSAFNNIKWGHVLGTRIETDMRGVLFRHLQKLSFSYFDRTKTGHIMSRLSNDLFTISEVAHHVPEDIFLAVITISGAFICMFWMNPLLAIIALIPIPLMIISGILFQKRFRKNVRAMRRRVADINANIENSIQGIREVKSFAGEQHAVTQFDEVNHDFRESKETMYHTMAAFHSTMMGLIHFHEILITVTGAVMVFNEIASISDVLVFLMFARFMNKPIDRMVNFVEQFGQGAASFERFTEIMDIEPDIQDRPNPVEPASVKGAIQINDLSFAYYGNDALVLKKISMNITSGQTVALVGESGAGKSTIAALIPRFYEACEGSISIDGVNVLDLRQQFLREQIGIVQQSPFLFDTTIRDNILFGNRDASEEEMMAAARQANILDFIESLPDGFDALVGEHGVKLSGGQKQRISIARVFLKNPPILIFDEATSALDTESEQLIQEAMERLCKDRTTIIIAHRLSTVKHADTIFVLRNGEVVENGSHAALTELKGYYHMLYTKSLF
ncbi:ABC transporter ATP-binding protein [Pontiella agarivorans]|uniref:ABC transporter ATP-binding protein n=1 Tax=Pontiella agarivorans TaxID=3038953 RepID=A0ABU5MV97_9BACT|nr:ABC transporter ATP-binding protein [Pontiella agarivorans]MDZ8118087.1 ABC transporter ATP-binding protein [Pontiella agarivorans]